MANSSRKNIYEDVWLLAILWRISPKSSLTKLAPQKKKSLAELAGIW